MLCILMLGTGSVGCEFLVAVLAFISGMLGFLMLIQGFSGAKLSVAGVATEVVFRSLVLISGFWTPEYTVAVWTFDLVLCLDVHTLSILVGKRTRTMRAQNHGVSRRWHWEDELSTPLKLLSHYHQA